MFVQKFSILNKKIMIKILLEIYAIWMMIMTGKLMKMRLLVGRIQKMRDHLVLIQMAMVFWIVLIWIMTMMV